MPAGRGLVGRRLRGGRLAAGGVPAALAGDLQALQRRRAGADALVGETVVEAGQHARYLLEAAHARGATGRRDLGAGPQVVDELPGRLRGLVVEELPVGHDDRREVTRRVALDPLEGDLAVGGRLVVPDAEVLADLVPDLVAAHDRAERVGADT